jgi:hypothetical protein
MEEEYKFTLGQCKFLIERYKSSCMRKNSKHKAVIQLRCTHYGLDKRNWTYYLELWVNGKMREQDLIRPEAYDALSYDDTLKKENFTNIEFITLLEHNPAPKKTDNQQL